MKRADLLVMDRPLFGPADHHRDAWCLAHRRRVRWAPDPEWWHHVNDRTTCAAMNSTYAPRRVR